MLWATALRFEIPVGSLFAICCINLRALRQSPTVADESLLHHLLGPG